MYQKKYSNTQYIFGNEFTPQEKLKGDQILQSNEIKTIIQMIGPHPTINSNRHKYEIGRLMYFNQMYIDDKLKKQIYDEAYNDGMEQTFRKYLLTKHDNSTVNDLTKFISKCFTENGDYIYACKKYFDRVRPEYLIPNFKPLIKTPNHPAYPSGHATQCMYAALMTPYYFNDNANLNIYISAAHEIAVNREKAGVHYISDTNAGYKLATYLANKKIGSSFYSV